MHYHLPAMLEKSWTIRLILIFLDDFWEMLEESVMRMSWQMYLMLPSWGPLGETPNVVVG